MNIAFSDEERPDIDNAVKQFKELCQSIMEGIFPDDDSIEESAIDAAEIMKVDVSENAVTELLAFRRDIEGGEIEKHFDFSLRYDNSKHEGEFSIVPLDRFANTLLRIVEQYQSETCLLSMLQLVENILKGAHNG